MVGELAKLLQVHYDKFWLMGATASYDNYLNLVGKFPSIEKDWNLQLLPITVPGLGKTRFLNIIIIPFRELWCRLCAYVYYFLNF